MSCKVAEDYETQLLARLGRSFLICLAQFRIGQSGVQAGRTTMSVCRVRRNQEGNVKWVWSRSGTNTGLQPHGYLFDGTFKFIQARDLSSLASFLCLNLDDHVAVTTLQSQTSDQLKSQKSTKIDSSTPPTQPRLSSAPRLQTCKAGHYNRWSSFTEALTSSTVNFLHSNRSKDLI